jgi:putative protease
MSPKDLCTIGFIDKIIKSGVNILKIEGRARSPEYVKLVSRCYREAVDSYFDGTYTKDKMHHWQDQLKTVFNRGFWDGYYLDQKLGEWSKQYGSRATKKKIYIGKGTNYFKNIQVAEFLIQSDSIGIGDEILITGPTTGVIETTVEEIRFELKNVEKAVKGQTVSIPIKQIVRRSDKLYKLVESLK